jgi:type IV secretory pathway VirB10-like protein
MTMTRKPIILGATLAAAALALGGCQDKAADKAAVAQGSAPVGTISDELPDLELLPNDAPLADPADVPPVPGVPGAPVDPAAVVPERALSSDAAKPATAPAPAEPALEGSIAE